MIKKQSLQNYYHNKLSDLLDFSSKYFFLDYESLKDSRETNLSKKRIIAFFAFTESSYVVLLRLALIYPFLFVLCYWLVTSNSVEIGTLKVFNEDVSFIERLGVVLGLSLIAYSLQLHRQSERQFFKALLSWVALCIPYVAFDLFLVAGESIAGIAILIALTGTSVFLSPFAFTWSLLTAGFIVALLAKNGFRNFLEIVLDPYYLIPYAVIIVFSIGIEFINNFARKNIQIISYWFLYFIGIMSYLFAIVYWIGSLEVVQVDVLAILVFLGVLPLVNSPLDWISFGVTRTLLYNIVDEVHSTTKSIIWSFADIIIALLLLIGIISFSTITISFSNYLVQLHNFHGPIIDLNIVFKDLKTNTFDDRYIWMYLMFLSTVLPTLIHLILASWSVIFWIPSKILKRMHKGWEANQFSHDLPKLLATTLYFTLFIPLTILSPLIILYLFHVIFIDWGYVFVIGETLLDSMKALAAYIDPSVKKI